MCGFKKIAERSLNPGLKSKIEAIEAGKRGGGGRA